MENHRIRPCLVEFSSHSLSATNVNPMNGVLCDFHHMLVPGVPALRLFMFSS